MTRPRHHPHVITFVHGEHGTTAHCVTCHATLCDPTTETEAVDAAGYHRRVEGPRIEGRAA